MGEGLQDVNLVGHLHRDGNGPTANNVCIEKRPDRLVDAGFHDRRPSDNAADFVQMVAGEAIFLEEIRHDRVSPWLTLTKTSGQKLRRCGSEDRKSTRLHYSH